jgi:hypothetical protein
MKSIDLGELSGLASHLQSAANEPIFVTKDGHTIAAIVPAADDDVESLPLSLNPKFQAILERSQSRLESEGGLTPADVRRHLNL